MTDTNPSDTEITDIGEERHGAARKNRGIRFSDPEWTAVKQAANDRQMTPAEFVRNTILDVVGGRADHESESVSPSLAPLIERTFRYTWMLVTRMRAQMIDAGEREALDKLLDDARKLQDDLLKTGPQ